MTGNDIAGPLFVLFFVSLFMCIVGYALFRFFFGFDQWGTLAREYRTSPEQGAPVSCWISLRFPPFRQGLSRAGEIWDGCLTVTPRGLQVSEQMLAGLIRPTMLIPWSDITVIGHRGRYEYEGGGVFLCFAKVQTVRMRISGMAVDALLKAGAPWQIKPEGAIVAKEQ